MAKKTPKNNNNKHKTPSDKQHSYLVCTKSFCWRHSMFHCLQQFTWRKVVPAPEAELVAEVAQLWPYQLGAWLTQTHLLSAVHPHQYQPMTCTVLIAIIIRTKHHHHSQVTAEDFHTWNCQITNRKLLWHVVKLKLVIRTVDRRSGWKETLFSKSHQFRYELYP